ncbi:MAG: glycosyltransferase [Dehalococcoidia bacterium]|nr:MAG: glycosyltransferase [Dehalococcoidia bacterium]
MTKVNNSIVLADGTVYSKRKNFCPFSTSPLEDYVPILGEERIERLQKIAQRVKGLKMITLNATAQGGGVAEMLYSAIPFLNMLGVVTEWKVICGTKEYFEATKELHNLLQGKEGSFSPELRQAYICTLEECARQNFIDYEPDVIDVQDPQPLGLSHYLRRPGATWLWRCHIDMDRETIEANPDLWDLLTDWAEHYDAVIFSAAQYILPRWPLPKFIIPPFIDPLSEKNKELSQVEIDRVLTKYRIDPKVPIIAQISRFDPWKGIDRTIATYRRVRKEKECQLILAGGLAGDDPEGERILARVYEDTKNDEDIHVLNLSLDDRLENSREVNALQRAARVIMQPSTKEGFGLVITEALWKGKPVIGADAGAIPLQIRDGDTGYFYQTSRKTAKKIIYLLEKPKAAEAMGKRGRDYVGQRFLLPDRIADYLMAINMVVSGAINKEANADIIISFSPWFKLSKRKRNQSL